MKTLPLRRWLKTMVVILGILLFAASGPCFALRDIGVVTKEQAREWGIELRAEGSGPEQVWLELEFKAEGKLKDFSHVELEIHEGEKMVLAYARLEAKRSPDGKVAIRFLTTRATLEKITLCVVLGVPGDVGYDLRVKELVVSGKGR